MQTRSRLAPFRRAQFRLPGRLSKSWQEHDAIVTAILRADGPAAESAAKAHVSLVSEASGNDADFAEMQSDIDEMQRMLEGYLDFARGEAVEAGLPAVMVGHLDVRRVDPRVPSSLSRRVVTGLLRRDLGFRGLVVTDSLQMAAVTRGRGPAGVAVAASLAEADRNWPGLVQRNGV